jgi:hydrogenase-4 component B
MAFLNIWTSAGDINLFCFSLIFTLLGVILVPFAGLRGRPILVILLVIANALLTTIPAWHVLTGIKFRYIVDGFLWFGELPLCLDPLSAWFIIIINITVINGAIYGFGYMNQYAGQKANSSLHWSLFLLFHTSMLWVCVVQNSLAFLIVWELMSLSSLFLVIFEHEKSLTLKSGINYLVQTHIGVAILTIAFIWVSIAENSFDFNAIQSFFAGNKNSWLFILFFIGFGFKAGFIPFHSWLPHAHPAAPSHISGIMSGVIVKLGIYGIFRMIAFLHQDYQILGEVVLAISLFTGLFGILNASVHRDFKKMLAFCTIENIGIIGIGIGIGLIGIGKDLPLLTILGFSGALLHSLNHSLFKSLLFFSAGSVYQQTHTRDMEKLGGLIKKMPQTAILFLLGAIAVGGLPPFNGFISEFIIYSGMLEGIGTSGSYNAIFMIINMAGLAIIGGVSILVFTKAFGTIFLGNPRSHHTSESTEVSLSMRIPQYFIIILILIIGIFPMPFFEKAIYIVRSVFGVQYLQDPARVFSIVENLANIGRYSALVLLACGVILLIRYFFTRRLPSRNLSTWGCGYVAPNHSMQYTSKSFSKSLGKLASFIVLEKKNFHELKESEIFPSQRKYVSHYNDFFESQIIDKLTNWINYFMNLFQFIQNGRTQMYILYGLFFIVMIFIGTLFKFI